MRNLDHFVMPVADLASARQRFSALGFTVATDAIHPFGTKNCCIFFEDGTFIEPLAIADRQLYDAADTAGNAFVANDKTFRAAQHDGFSQIVIQSDDAADDDAQYREEGISGGALLDFGRHFTRPDGTQGEVAFRLAFAAPEKKANEHDVKTGFFACEVIKSIPGGRGALVDHANGAKVTIAIIATAGDPMATDEFLELFLETESTAGVEVFYPMDSSALRVMRPDMFALMTDVKPIQTEGFALAALVIGVISLDGVQQILRQNYIVHHEKSGWVIVPPAAGQSVTLIFQSPE